MENTMTVTIPSKKEHEGIYSMTIKISDKCPECGRKRGEPHQAFSFDGSRRLIVSGWENPCGHLDLYSNVRNEYHYPPLKENSCTQ